MGGIGEGSEGSEFQKPSGHLDPQMFEILSDETFNQFPNHKKSRSQPFPRHFCESSPQTREDPLSKKGGGSKLRINKSTAFHLKLIGAQKAMSLATTELVILQSGEGDITR